MGQSCSKDSVHKARPASLDPAPQVIYEIADSNEDSELEKNRNSAHAACEELLARLSADEVEALLKSFRVKSQLERTILHQGYDQTLWKKLSLTKTTLREALCLFNRTVLRKRLCSYLHGHVGSCKVSLSNEIEILSSSQIFRTFKSADYLFGKRDAKMFSVKADDKNGAIGFQEFAATISICLHGTKEEMLAVLFLLFAEATGSEEIVEDPTSTLSQIERKSNESESVRPITIASTPTASLSTKDSSRSTSFHTVVTKKKDFFTAKVSSRMADNSIFSFLGHRFLGSNHMASLIITELGVYKLLLFFIFFFNCEELLDDSYSYQTRGRLWSHLEPNDRSDFFSTMELIIAHINRLAMDQSPAVSLGYDSFVLLFMDRNAIIESISDPKKSFFSSIHRVPSGGVSEALHPPTPGSAPPTTSNSSVFPDTKKDSFSNVMNSSSATELPSLIQKIYFEYGKEKCGSVLRSYAEGAVHNYMNTLKAAHEFYEREKYRREIKLNNDSKPPVEASPSGNESAMDNKIPPESRMHDFAFDAENVNDENCGFYDFVSQINFETNNMQFYPVFVMEATWFEWWCQYMEVRPVYLDKPNVRSLVIDLAPIIAGESDPQIAAAAIAQKSPSAFIISGHFPSSQYSYSRRNAFRSYRDDIKILVNRNLMQRNFPFKGMHTFLGPPQLKEWTNSSSLDSGDRYYVLLPYRFGATLHREYDTDSDIASESYKRYLVFDDDLLRQKRLLVANTEVSTEDRQLNVAHLNGKPEVITGVQDLFSRMKAVPTITVDLYPVQIPIFCCTRAGVASTTHFDSLFIDALELQARDKDENHVSLDCEQQSSCFPARFLWRYQLVIPTKLFIARYMQYLNVGISLDEESVEHDHSSDMKDSGLVPKQPLHYRDVRWWGLCANDSCTGITVGHSAQHHWRLLTTTEADYDLPFIDLIRNAQMDNAYYPALMMEFRNTHLHWPTNRLRSWCNGKHKIHLQPQEKLIGQAVDILTDGNYWSAGRVAAISRDTATSASTVSITVQLLDSPNSQQSDHVSVTLGSGRIISYGCMTQLFSPFSNNNTAIGNSSMRKLSPSVPGTFTNAEFGHNDHKSRRVADLPPLLVSVELETSFIQTIHFLRGMGKEKVEQHSRFVTKLEKRRNLHAEKLKMRQDKRAALKVYAAAQTMAEDGATYGQENKSPVDRQSTSLNEGGDDEEDLDNGSGEVSVSSSGGNLGTLKKILSRSGSKVLPINGSGNPSPTVEDRDAVTLLHIDEFEGDDDDYSTDGDEKDDIDDLRYLFKPTVDITTEKTSLVSILFEAPRPLYSTTRWPALRMLYCITRTDDILFNNDSRMIECSLPIANNVDKDESGNHQGDGMKGNDAISSPKNVTVIGRQSSGSRIIQINNANENLTSSTIDTFISDKQEEGGKNMLTKKVNDLWAQYMRSLSSRVRSLFSAEKGRASKADKLDNMYYTNYNKRVSNNVYRSDGVDNNRVGNNHENKAHSKTGTGFVGDMVFNHERVRMNVGIVGLNNLGNTCYLSSAVQCLLRTPLLIPYFLTGQYQTYLNKSIGNGRRLVSEFEFVLRRIFNCEILSGVDGVYLTLAADALTSRAKQKNSTATHKNNAGAKYNSISPTEFLRTFQHLKPYFYGQNQQDAQEFLSELLDTFHEELKKSVPKKKERNIQSHIGNAVESSENEVRANPQSNDLVEAAATSSIEAGSSPAKDVAVTVPSAKTEKDDSKKAKRPPPKLVDDLSINEINKRGNEQWELYIQKNSSIISHVFTGQLCSKVICKNCNFTSVKFEVFNTLSLPLPKYYNSNMGSPPPSARYTEVTVTSKPISVIVTVIRKMPRYSHISTLKKKYRSKYFDEKYFGEITRMLSSFVRVVVSVPRNTTINDLKIKAANAYNSMLRRIYQSAKEEAIKGEVAMEKGSSNGSSFETNDTSNLVGTIGVQVPDLLFSNACIMDLSGDSGVKKMLDETESLSSLVDEDTATICMAMQENNKDTAYLASLDGSDLIYSTHYGSKSAATAAAKNLKPAEGLAYFFSYVDNIEYNASQLQSIDWRPSEGNFFADYDFNYSNSCINSSGLSQNSSTTTKSKKNRKLVAESGNNSVSSSTVGEGESSSFRKTFPAHVKDFSIGDRIDAVDHKSMWYSGTIVDVYNIAMVDVRKYGFKKYPRKISVERSSINHSNSKSKNQPQDTSKPVYVTSGYSVRIHFDYFSSIWDEWYDQQDFENGCIAPIYSKTNRKVKILNFQIVQRIIAPYILEEDDLSEEEEEEMTNVHSKVSMLSVKNSITSGQKLPSKNSLSSKDKSKNAKSAAPLVSSHSYRVNDGSIASERQGTTATGSVHDGSQTSTKTEYRIEILDSPLLIQCESYRTTQHLYNIITEQIVRYYTPAETKEFYEKEWDSFPKPFTIRMVSGGNLSVPPADMQKYWTNGVERFYGFKNWEGSELYAAYPALVAAMAGVDSVDMSGLVGDNFSGPVSGIHHNRLVLTVDWHLDKRQSSYEEMWRRRDMRIINDSSYIQHLKVMNSAEAGLGGAQSIKSEGTSKSPASSEMDPTRVSEALNTPSETPIDRRNGMDLEFVLRKFVEVEDIDEYVCDNCKAAVPALLRTTIFRLPDVLILHLKRLVINSTGGGKIRTLVKFPIENLDVSPFLCGEGRSNTTYNLYGVVNHLGGMYGGHYTSFAKCESIVLGNNYSGGGGGGNGDGDGDGFAVGPDVGEVSSSSSSWDTIASKVSLAGHLKLKNKTPNLSEYITLGKAVDLQSSVKCKWLKFDDEFVSEMPVHENPFSLVTDGAYLLFYERNKFSVQNLVKYI